MSEDGINFEKYISMSEFSGNCYFFGNDIKVEEQDIEFINPLSREYSSYLWDKYVSKRYRHLMQMDKHEWPLSLKLEEFNWEEDWQNSIYDNFREYVHSRITFKDD